jgi:hypothetical protein
MSAIRGLCALLYSGLTIIVWHLAKPIDLEAEEYKG